MRYRKLILIFACVFVLTGCGRREYTGETDTLWILTEKSNSDGMNLQAEIIAERMEAAYPGLTIILGNL